MLDESVAAGTGFRRLPAEIGERLKAYVYTLSDPRTNEIFYVGKGNGSRLLSHGLEAMQLSEGPQESAKIKRIHAIRTGGHEPLIHVVRHGLSDSEAFLVEAALIDVLPDLTNKVRGSGAATGVIVLNELIARYAAPQIGVMQWPVMFITLGDWEPGADPVFTDRAGGGYYPGMSEKELYDATRCWWKVSPARLSRDGIELAVPVHRGITRGVFKIDRWLRHPTSARRAFEGINIPTGPIFEQLVGDFGKRISTVHGAQNPIRYRLAGEQG